MNFYGKAIIFRKPERLSLLCWANIRKQSNSKPSLINKFTNMFKRDSPNKPNLYEKAVKVLPISSEFRPFHV